MEKMNESCSVCGHSVAMGSGKFANRIPDVSLAQRLNEQRPHPEGDYLCEDCLDGFEEGGEDD